MKNKLMKIYEKEVEDFNDVLAVEEKPDTEVIKTDDIEDKELPIEKEEIDDIEIEDDIDPYREMKKPIESSLNSLYTGDGEDYKNTPFLYVNGFWISTLGLLALSERFPDSIPIETYLMKPTPLTNEYITEFGDYYTDLIASTKALYDNGLMLHNVWELFMQYFRQLANNKYNEVDIDTFISLVKKMIYIYIRPHQIIQGTIHRILNKEAELQECIEPLYKFNEQYLISKNFRKFCQLHKQDLYLS